MVPSKDGAPRQPYGRVPVWMFRDAPSGALRLYGWLAGTYANRHTGACWPSRPRLARDLGVNVKTIDRAIQDLVEIEALAVRPRKGANGGGATNCLVLLGLDRGDAPRLAADRGFAEPGPLDKVVQADPLDKTFQDSEIRETKESPKPEYVEPEIGAKAPSRAKSPRRTKDGAFTEQDRDDLVAKWTPSYGNADDVRDEIDQALNHEARLTKINERLYVDGWLRREVRRRPVASTTGRREPYGNNSRSEPEAAEGMRRIRYIRDDPELRDIARA